MMFSVIVPVYNAEKYLRPCLESVLAQTEPDWECICVDDGSTDASGAILDEFAARDPRFKVIHQANGGEGAARNAGMKAASGAWITWIDADDIYADDRLAEARRLIEAERPDMVRFRTFFGVEPGVDWVACRRGDRAYEVFQGMDARRWGWRVLAPGGMVWTWVVRREVLKGHVFRLGMRVKVDSIFSGGLANYLGKVVQSEYRSYFYRYVETSAIHSVRRADDCLRLLEAVRDLWRRESVHARALDAENSVDGGEPLFETMKRWLRVHCECDVIDWILKRRGEDCRGVEIHSLFLELAKEGTFDCASLQSVRFRLPILLWRLTGLTGWVACVGKAIDLFRRIIVTR